MYSQVSSFHCRYTGVLRIVQKRWHPWRFSSVVYSLVTHCTDRACKQTVWVVFTITHCTQKACKQTMCVVLTANGRTTLKALVLI